MLAVSKRWKEPEAHYRKTYRTSPLPLLGEVQFVEVEPAITVANIIGQHGIRRGPEGKPPIRYKAVEEALAKIARYASQHQATIHMSRIGCGLAGGRWEEIEPIIERTLAGTGIEVVVYDYSA